MAVTEERECKKHGMTTYVYRKSENTWRCRKCEYDAVAKRRRKLKIKAVEYLGGKCIKCGYDKCIGALEFHHTDPKEKDFTISGGRVLGWERTKNELDKCVLLCANCHREEHYIAP